MKKIINILKKIFFLKNNCLKKNPEIIKGDGITEEQLIKAFKNNLKTIKKNTMSEKKFYHITKREFQKQLLNQAIHTRYSGKEKTMYVNINPTELIVIVEKYSHKCNFRISDNFFNIY